MTGIINDPAFSLHVQGKNNKMYEEIQDRIVEFSECLSKKIINDITKKMMLEGKFTLDSFCSTYNFYSETKHLFHSSYGQDMLDKTEKNLYKRGYKASVEYTDNGYIEYSARVIPATSIKKLVFSTLFGIATSFIVLPILSEKAMQFVEYK